MASPSSPQPRASCAQAVAEVEPPRDRGQVPSATDNQPRSMERDYDFVERPSQYFFCPVSLELLLEPQLTSCCGHHLSRDAATRLQREGKPCPMCNEQEWNSMLDKFHKRKVHEVRVRCPHEVSGCDWVGEVNGLKRHADSCTKRPWECEYCGLKCTYGEGEEEHWPTCCKFPEPCPNGCEVGSVERCNVEQHHSVCSLEPVACGMKEFGCSAVVPRKELATHMRESELQHLTAMAVLNLRLSRQLQQDSTERDRKITRLQQDMAEQKQLQTEMKTKMDEQKQMQVEMKKEIGQEIAGLKQQQVKEITGLKEGQKREGSQVKDAIAALSQQVEREKETMTELQTKTREEMKKETKQFQTEMKAKMDEQKREVVELKAQVQAVQHTTQHIEEHTAGGCSFCKIITFTKYGQHKGSGSSDVYSDPFYSYHHGYKFKLRIIYADGAFLYFFLETGEYDDQLHWPVEVKIRLELLNQAGDHHHVERINTTCKWEKNERDKYHTSCLMTFTDMERKGGGMQYMMNDSLKFRLHLTVLSA